MDNQTYIQERKDRWMLLHAHKSQLLGTQLLGMHPELGFLIKVQGIDISEDFFPDEYNQIVKAYQSVINKMDQYCKEHSKLNKSLKHGNSL